MGRADGRVSLSRAWDGSDVHHPMPKLEPPLRQSTGKRGFFFPPKNEQSGPRLRPSDSIPLISQDRLAWRYELVQGIAYG